MQDTRGASFSHAAIKRSGPRRPKPRDGQRESEALDRVWLMRIAIRGRADEPRCRNLPSPHLETSRANRFDTWHLTLLRVDVFTFSLSPEAIVLRAPLNEENRRVSRTSSPRKNSRSARDSIANVAPVTSDTRAATYMCTKCHYGTSIDQVFWRRLSWSGTRVALGNSLRLGRPIRAKRSPPGYSDWSIQRACARKRPILERLVIG